MKKRYEKKIHHIFCPILLQMKINKKYVFSWYFSFTIRTSCQSKKMKKKLVDYFTN